MKKLLFSLMFVVFFCSESNAGVQISIGFPFFVPRCPPPIVYVSPQPQVVYVNPQTVIVQQQPVVVAQPPVVYVQPSPVIVIGPAFRYHHWR